MKIVAVGALIFASCLSVAWANNSAPESQEPDHVKQLKWLDSADADKMFQGDIKAGVFQFYVVCGLSCEPPGLNKLDAVQCYPLAKLTRMTGTADALQSETDRSYQDKAGRFAVRYNVQMAEYLSRHEMTDCVVGESWEGAILEMDRRLAKQDVTGDFVDMAFSKKTNKFRLTAHLSPENRNTDIEEQLCFIALDYHLSGKVIVEIYDRKDSVSPSSIECRYGQVFPSDWKPIPSDYPYDSLEN